MDTVDVPEMVSGEAPPLVAPFTELMPCEYGSIVGDAQGHLGFVTYRFMLSPGWQDGFVAGETGLRRIHPRFTRGGPRVITLPDGTTSALDYGTPGELRRVQLNLVLVYGNPIRCYFHQPTNTWYVSKPLKPRA